MLAKEYCHHLNWVFFPFFRCNIAQGMMILLSVLFLSHCGSLFRSKSEGVIRIQITGIETEKQVLQLILSQGDLQREKEVKSPNVEFDDVKLNQTYSVTIKPPFPDGVYCLVLGGENENGTGRMLKSTQELQINCIAVPAGNRFAIMKVVGMPGDDPFQVEGAGTSLEIFNDGFYSFPPLQEKDLEKFKLTLTKAAKTRDCREMSKTTTGSQLLVEWNCGRIMPFYRNGADWGDNIANDGKTLLSASDTPCRKSDCLSGALLRKAALSLPSCENVSVSDSLGAFQWICDEVDGRTWAISTGFSAGKTILDLINREEEKWKENTLQIQTGDGKTSEIQQEIWWRNKIVVDRSLSGEKFLINRNKIIFVAGDNLEPNAKRSFSSFLGKSSGFNVINLATGYSQAPAGLAALVNGGPGVMLSYERFNLLSGIRKFLAPFGFGAGISYWQYQSQRSDLSAVNVFLFSVFSRYRLNFKIQSRQFEISPLLGYRLYQSSHTQQGAQYILRNNIVFLGGEYSWYLQRNFRLGLQGNGNFYMKEGNISFDLMLFGGYSF